ncbi:MAG: ECF transporter S component [Ruminococcaceae bacterium]|nr:ECF transporter S component [Oscillospiraceae bacterium]
MTDEIKNAAEATASENGEAKRKPNDWKSSKTYFIARLAILTAIIVVMAFTPLGYLPIGAMKASLLTIPVVVGAIWLGPSAGAILGGIFGITSFIQCFGLDALGVLLLAENPILAFIVCFVPRLIMGWLVGVIFKGISLVKPLRFTAYTVASFSGAALNTCFFMTALIGLFGQGKLAEMLSENFGMDLGKLAVIQFAAAFVGINALIELAICTIFGMVISRILSTADKRSLEKAKKRTEKEAAELAAQNEQLKTEKDSLSSENRALGETLSAVTEENKSLKEKLKDTFDKDDNGRADFIDALDKDNNGKIDLFEKKKKSKADK